MKMWKFESNVGKGGGKGSEKQGYIRGWEEGYWAKYGLICFLCIRRELGTRVLLGVG